MFGFFCSADILCYRFVRSPRFVVIYALALLYDHSFECYNSHHNVCVFAAIQCSSPVFLCAFRTEKTKREKMAAASAGLSSSSFVGAAGVGGMCIPVDEAFAKSAFGELECAICTSLAWDAVSPPCGVHVFCRRCLAEWLTRHQTCPTCKVKTVGMDATKPLAVSNPIAYRMLSKIKVHCPKHYRPAAGSGGGGGGGGAGSAATTEVEGSTTPVAAAAGAGGSGCTYTGEYSDALTTHLQRSCAFEPVVCPLRCSIGLIPRGQLASHALVCDRRPISCEFCKAGVAFAVCACGAVNPFPPKNADADLVDWLLCMAGGEIACTNLSAGACTVLIAIRGWLQQNCVSNRYEFSSRKWFVCS